MKHAVARSLTIGLLASLFLALHSPAQAREVGEPEVDVLFIGDSTTARYNDVTGSAKRGWWSIVAHQYRLELRLSAESGSGMLHHGRRCAGTRFGDRLKAVDQARPDIIFAIGGRNDYRYCVKGKAKRATQKQMRTAVKDYYRLLAKRADRLGVERDHVIVGTNWGTTLKKWRDPVKRAIKKYAKHYGFTYVALPTLKRSETVDGTHANKAGNERIARSLLDRKRVRAALRHARDH